MKFVEVAQNVKRLVESRACETGCRTRQQRSGNPPVKDEFIYELLLAYGTPKATIARLETGSLNLSKEPGEILLKKKVYFKADSTATTHPVVPAPLPEWGSSPSQIPSTGGVAEGRGGLDIEIPSMGGVAERRGGLDIEIPSAGGVAEGRGGF